MSAHFWQSTPKKGAIPTGCIQLRWYIPAKILHRDKEMANLADNLECVIEGNRPNDVILYGKAGTGRTLTVRFVTRELQKATTNVIIAD